MPDIIDATDLASYLRDPNLSDDESLVQIVDLVNALLNESWAAPVDPIPTKVRLLALNVGARAWAWDPSKANLESLSRSIDDGSRTERYRVSSINGSVYLTSDELAVLQGKTFVRSVRLVNYGDTVL